MRPASTNAKGRSRAERDAFSEADAFSETRNDAGSEEIYFDSDNCGDNRMMDPRTASRRVRVQNMSAGTTSTITVTGESAGDNHGGGLINASRRGDSRILVGSSRVVFEGAPVAYSGSTTTQNGLANTNAPKGQQDQTSQTLVYVTP